MSLENNKINIWNRIFLIAFCSFVGYMALTNTLIFKINGINPHTNYIIILFIGIFLCKSIFDYHSQIEIALMIILLIISFIISIYSHDLIIPLDVSMIFAAKNVNFFKLIKGFFYVITIITILAVLASLFKILPNITFLRGSNVRNTFGFVYPVSLSENITVASISYFVVNLTKKIKIYEIFILLFLTYFVIHYSGTRMDYYCMLMLVIVISIKKFIPAIINIFPFSFFWLSLPIMSIATIYYSYNFNYSSKFYYYFNNISENRLMYSNMALKKYGFSLFGRHIYEDESANSVSNSITGAKYFYIDQSIIRMGVLYGIIILLIFILSYTYKMYKLHLYNMNYLVLLYSILVIRSFFDTNIFQINGDPFLIIIFASIPVIQHILSSHTLDVQK